jgi:hypothetical protein
LKDLEAGGRRLKTVKEIRRRWMNEFHPFQPSGSGKLGELEESPTGLKNRKGAEDGRSQPRNRARAGR